MATAHFVLAGVSSRGTTGATMPVLDPVPKATKTVTPLAGAADVAITGMVAGVGLYWHVTTDVAIFVTFDGSTAPGVDVGYFIPAGQSLQVSAGTGAPKVKLA